MDQNRTAMDASMVQVVQSIVRLAQPVFFGVECDEATIRERHQLDQFGVGVNQIPTMDFSVVIISIVGMSILPP